MRKCGCRCHVCRSSAEAGKAARTKLRNRMISDTQHALGVATREEAVAWLIADWRLRGVEMPEGFVEAQ